FWDEIWFPFDPALRDREQFSGFPVEYSSIVHGQIIEELYQCDSAGSIAVTITNQSAGYSKVYKLGHWAEEQKPLKAARRSKPAKARAHGD
ncbi:MAG: hypothetical protein JO061_12065, partial [Acidobacteriaceae bacterium]|nr:hypothetical protein [Acidobacteriaceae bacterium]